MSPIGERKDKFKRAHSCNIPFFGTGRAQQPAVSSTYILLMIIKIRSRRT